MKLFFNDFLKFEDKILFSASNYNGLFEHSFLTKETKLLFDFEMNDIGINYLYTKLVKYQDSVWILPNNSKYLYEYNLLDGNLRYYSLPQEWITVDFSLFLDGTIVDDKLYLLPCRYDGVLIFDIKSREFINRIDLKKMFDVTSGLYCFKGIDVCDRKIYIASFIENKYIILDSTTGKYETRLLDEDYGGISHLLIRNKRINIFGKNGKIGTYTLDGEKLKTVNFSTKMDGPHFYDVCEENGVFFCTENYNKKIAIYDSKTGEKKELEYPVSDNKEFTDFWANALCIKNDNGIVLFQSAYDGMLFGLHGDSIEKIGTIDWDISDDELKKIWATPNVVIKEQCGLSLPQLIRAIRAKEKY